MSDNGERFADAYAANELVLRGTIFPHKIIHKITWVSPDNHTENQIDHIRQDIQDPITGLRSYRGADAGSDHHLVIGKVQLKLKRQRRCTGQRVRYNVSLLKDKDHKEQFNITLKNRFQVLEQDLEVDGNVEGNWEDVKACWIQTCQEVLGKRERHHKPWISAKTLGLIRERKKKKEAVNLSKTRTAKAAAQEAYSQAMRDVKSSVKEDKRKFADELAQGCCRGR